MRRRQATPRGFALARNAIVFSFRLPSNAADRQSLPPVMRGAPCRGFAPFDPHAPRAILRGWNNSASHVLRALKENARQGVWNGSLPPIGYRAVAAEQRGTKVKKKLEIDPLHADTVRLAFRLALEGNGASGPMGVKQITSYLNARHIFTRDGGRWGIGTVHRLLTRPTYIGRHEFNKRGKTKELKPADEVIRPAPQAAL